MTEKENGDLLAEYVKRLEDLRVEMKADLAEHRAETLARFDNIQLTLKRLDDFPDNLQRLNKMVLDQNTENITAANKMSADLSANTIATKEIKASVESVVSLLKFGKATLTFGHAVGEFMKWVGAIGVGVAVLYGLWSWLSGHGWPPLPPPDR